MRVAKTDDLDERFWGRVGVEDMPSVREILSEVRARGDEAVREYTLQFDGVSLGELRIGTGEVDLAYEQLDDETISALEQAADHIRRFAERQKQQLADFEYEIQPGVFVGQRVVSVERVGVYVPGGRYPLPSTVLMCAVPAAVAGVQEIALCSPPSHEGTVHPAILAAARIAGVDELYRIGGVPAIGAMAYGTGTLSPVDKVVGPGNRYVAQAERLVFGAVGIDFVAGPSEILVLADDSADPAFVAADLLAQAEHDPDAVSVLVTTSASLADAVNAEVEAQAAELSTGELIGQALRGNGVLVVAESMDEAIEFANRKAPEHLQLLVARPEECIDKLRNYGTLFVGPYAAVALGDYSSGLNHTLPTNGAARYTGGLSVMDFLKVQTTLRVERDGLACIGPVARQLARTEGLAAHARSVDLRLNP
jgi:histidinol dehydrogenase